jgi:hypothetical protein
MKPMKTKKPTLIISIVIIGLMLGGALALQSRADTLAVDVFITPWVVSLEDMGPEQFQVRISLPNGYNHGDIDPDSIRIDGRDVTKDDPDYPKIKKNYFKYLADGSKVMSWIILPRVWHMSPGPSEHIWLTLMLTGELYDDTPFEGPFDIRVIAETDDNSHGVPPP